MPTLRVFKTEKYEVFRLIEMDITRISLFNSRHSL